MTRTEQSAPGAKGPAHKSGRRPAPDAEDFELQDLALTYGARMGSLIPFPDTHFTRGESPRSAA